MLLALMILDSYGAQKESFIMENYLAQMPIVCSLKNTDLILHFEHAAT